MVGWDSLQKEEGVKSGLTSPPCSPLLARYLPSPQLCTFLSPVLAQVRFPLSLLCLISQPLTNASSSPE